MDEFDEKVLFEPLKLPCGVVLKNRLAKAAMSDSLGDGRGGPTQEQEDVYGRWADGGVALSLVGEVQMSPHYAEKPGNLVLSDGSDPVAFRALAQCGSANASQLWLQLGHAGAMADAPISTPKGPSALDLDGLTCGALSLADIKELPSAFARTAVLARDYGFGGVEIHAAHGFLLSQFLSPLFNKRTDDYGGCLENRMRLVLEAVAAVRVAVGPDFPVGIKLNATDQLEGGFDQDEALKVIAALDQTGLDLIDISGGTYFPGAPSSSDRAGSGPYFLEFAKRARGQTRVPLMVTGGFKTRAQAIDAIASGAADVVGLARALVIAPDLPNLWQVEDAVDPTFPKFASPPEGGVTAWYTMQITQIATGGDVVPVDDLGAVIEAYARRDAQRREIWKDHFKI